MVLGPVQAGRGVITWVAWRVYIVVLGRGVRVFIGLWGTWYSRLVEVLILNGGASKTCSGLNCLTQSVVVP